MELLLHFFSCSKGIFLFTEKEREQLERQGNSLKKYVNKIWIVALAFLTCYLLYQLLFVWESDFDEYTDEAIIPEDQVVFLTVSEKFYGVKKGSFNYLLDSLETWKFDRKKEEVSLKFDSQLPKSNTQVMVIYDRGFNSFEKYSEVFSINSFPYLYYFNSEPMMTVYQITEDGVIYLNFEGKKVKLKPNESHHTWSFEGFQLSKIKVTNQGLYKKDQFKKFDEPTKKKQPKKEKEPAIVLPSKEDQKKAATNPPPEGTTPPETLEEEPSSPDSEPGENETEKANTEE